ncbi:hypothetical protein EOW65_08930 [Sinirhodobacter ferrireducens]|uniref:Uncharacterized protein n=1 Tax=Paenirhodobacter ferrireducens TaxID=1215032 RepID=A0A443LJU9_9RHOB|nr:hypothetical protein [Sinirhodobacter ferrireducens]RWR49393.1 hypothetical protein EOW65_08930 [Sinirhodobacter ferrireducens]
MPRGAGQPLFLARRSYRRRRMMDGGRVLPLLGAVLLLLPGLWHSDGSDWPGTGAGGIYLFLVWSGLILAAFGLARGLGPALEAEEEAVGGPPLGTGPGEDG